jgi:hypothetical protein
MAPPDKDYPKTVGGLIQQILDEEARGIQRRQKKDDEDRIDEDRVRIADLESFRADFRQAAKGDGVYLDADHCELLAAYVEPHEFSFLKQGAKGDGVYLDADKCELLAAYIENMSIPALLGRPPDSKEDRDAKDQKEIDARKVWDEVTQGLKAEGGYTQEAIDRLRIAAIKKRFPDYAHMYDVSLRFKMYRAGKKLQK